MTNIEKWFLAEIRAKLGEDAELPTHHEICGIWWFDTCLSCLRLWKDDERRREIPKSVQDLLWGKTK